MLSHNVQTIHDSVNFRHSVHAANVVKLKNVLNLKLQTNTEMIFKVGFLNHIINDSRLHIQINLSIPVMVSAIINMYVNDP